MKINQKLNLVVSLEDGNGDTYYIHSTPLSREAFEANYLLLSQGFSAMVENGIQITAGPRVASLVLKEIAETMGKQAAYDSVMAEVRRLSTVIKAGPDGYEPLPMATAVARGTLDKDDQAYAESLIVFFMLVSAIWSGDRRKASLNFMNGLWKSQNTSSNVTDFIASLPTSTEGESSGETVVE